MFGYDGHRGWLKYFAVLPQFQKKRLWKTYVRIWRTDTY